MTTTSITYRIKGTEYTVWGSLKPTIPTGYYRIIVKGREVACVHWTNIKSFFPQKPGYF